MPCHCPRARSRSVDPYPDCRVASPKARGRRAPAYLRVVPISLRQHRADARGGQEQPFDQTAEYRTGQERGRALPGIFLQLTFLCWRSQATACNQARPCAMQ